MSKRINVGKMQEVIDLPNLTEIQTNSYTHFLQLGVPKGKRRNIGLQAVFKEVFPIESYDGTYKLEYVGYALSEPKYSLDECFKRSLTFAASLKVKMRLKGPKETKEQDVYMGELPLMTSTGTFVVNGDERVVVTPMHRSPPSFF